MKQCEFSRIWAMPSRETYKIKPVKELLWQEVTTKGWIDPFAGNSRWATMTNDLNPETTAAFHMDAHDFLCGIDTESVPGVLYDPPYSVRQVAECYKNFGLEVTQETTRADWYTKLKKEIARIVEPGGKVISFGWNSGGIGKTLGFEIIRILLIPHGGIHNDTIVTVERKIRSQPDLPMMGGGK